MPPFRDPSSSHMAPRTVWSPRPQAKPLPRPAAPTLTLWTKADHLGSYAEDPAAYGAAFERFLNEDPPLARGLLGQRLDPIELHALQWVPSADIVTDRTTRPKAGA